MVSSYRGPLRSGREQTGGPPADSNMAMCFSCLMYKQAAYRHSSQHVMHARTLTLTRTPNILLYLMAGQAPTQMHCSSSEAEGDDRLHMPMVAVTVT